MARTRQSEAAEELAAKRDASAQEKAPAGLKAGRYSFGFVYATNPDNGLEVVFKPGELLPEWAVESRGAEAW